LSVAGNTTIGVSEKIIAGLKAEKAKFKSPNGKKAKALQARIERVEALVAAFKEAQRSNQGVARDRTLEKAITEDYIQLLMSESTLSELIDKATALDIDVDKRLSIASQLSASQDDKFNQIKVTGAELDEDSDSDKRVLAEAIAKKTSREEIKATKQSVQDYRDFLGEGRGDALLVAKHREAYRALVKLKARLAESPGKAELKQIEKQARAQHKIVTDIEQVFSGIQELATFKPANTDLSKQKIAQSIVERHDGDEKAYVKDTKPEAIRADAKSLGIRTTKKQSAENIASKIFTFNSGGGPIKFTQLQVKKAEKARKKFQKQTQSIIDTMNVGLKNVDTGTLGTSRKSKDKEVIKTRIIRKAFNKIDILRAEVRKVSAAAGIDPEAILGTVSYKDLGANDRLAKLLGNVRQRRFDLGQAAIDSETQVVSKTAGFKGEIADESVLSNEEEIAQLTREQEIDDVTTEVYGEEIVSESQRDPLDILQEEEESGGSVYTGGGNFGKRGETKKFLGSKLQDKEIVDTDEGIALLPRLRKGQGLVITVGEGQAGFFSTNPDDGSVNVGNTGLAYHHEAFKNYDVIEVYKHDTNKLNELAIVHIRIPKVKNSVAKPEITYVTKHIKDDGRKTSAAKASEVSNAMPWVDVTTVAQIAYAKVMGSMPKSKQSADIQIAELLNEGYNAVRTEASKNDANPFYSALGTGSDLMTRTAKARQDAMLTSAGMTEVGETLASEPTGKKTDAAKKIDQTVSGLKKLSPETKEGTAVHNFGLDVKAAKEFADSVLERRQEFKEEKARLDAPSKSEDQATGKADYKMFKDDPDNQNYCGV